VITLALCAGHRADQPHCVRRSRRPSTPIGVGEISRRLSEATPPVRRPQQGAAPRSGCVKAWVRNLGGGGVGRQSASSTVSSRMDADGPVSGSRGIGTSPRQIPAPVAPLMHAFTHPSGVPACFRPRSGGVASLNPRLISSTPPGVAVPGSTVFAFVGCRFV
jgi:hypothetical protein